MLIEDKDACRGFYRFYLCVGSSVIDRWMTPKPVHKGDQYPLIEYIPPSNNLNTVSNVVLGQPFSGSQFSVSASFATVPLSITDESGTVNLGSCTKELIKHLLLENARFKIEILTLKEKLTKLETLLCKMIESK